MLYDKKSLPALTDELFQNPTSEYRGTPFFSWNCKLEKEELLWQIDRLKEMGFGGFHMHARPGLATKYLGPEFMDLIKACTQKAEQENMLAWLYDEDRWPSGSAGGYVTKDRRYSCKYICFSCREEEVFPRETGIAEGKPYLLACYDICLRQDGTLESYRQIDTHAQASGCKWYVYVKTTAPSGFYNNQTYVDTLSKEAMDRFIQITYETYAQHVGDSFGGSIKAIFTDEPQFAIKQTLAYAQDKSDVKLPWTTDFDKLYQRACGIDLLAHLPELIWDLPDGQPSPARYHYHDIICETFTRAFSDNCGRWCEEHGISLTGHVLEEPTLHSQTNAVGEAMRAYRSFGIPGIDMLSDNIELSTAKQTQSACHQYGKEGMLSELYGATNWDFDFRGHKFQGDWQAALGVTVRVPHLSWVSMKGSAKRDYPASLHYQSPWYKEYPYIEDHFARVNTALTRGTPVVNVGVIHPVESYWLHYGPSENTAEARSQLESNFTNIIHWLLFGTVDFDFISEALLPGQWKAGDPGKLTVGEMQYSAVVVPGCETLRGTTLEILRKFQAQGGKVIFVGECPKFVDAKPSAEVQALYSRAVHADFSQMSVLQKLEAERTLTIRNSDASMTDNLIYQMRQDQDCRWVFIAHGKKARWRDNLYPQDILIHIAGEYEPVIYDTANGGKRTAEFYRENGMTVVSYTLYAQDSLLLRLELPRTAGTRETRRVRLLPEREIRLLDNVSYQRAEPNVYLLDMAQYSLDEGKTFSEPEEILRIDLKIRKEFGYPKADGQDVQPWAIPEETIAHYPILRFRIESEIETSCRLAYEEAEAVVFNGEQVPVAADGYFVDHSIHTMALPALRAGTNELLIRVPIGKRISIENFFLLGEFGVRAAGCEKTIIKAPEKIGFSSITHQGMPFYGGNVTYRAKVALPACRLVIRANYYRGALISVKMDGREAGKIVFDPFCIDIGQIESGEHEFEFTLFGNRFNTFGALHYCGDKISWFGPEMWYQERDEWSYEYQLRDTGILASPIFEIYEEK